MTFLLDGFDFKEEAMIHMAIAALENAGYDLSVVKQLIRADMPPGYRAMTLADGAALATPAFASQAILNHVLEEELIHLFQKQQGLAGEFGPTTAQSLENEVDENRKFPLPKPNA
ncbi:MAG TPA: hypothetical protein VE988_24820 [Gemmataceae bacterium]|nr:hypothetical protein [Gemmataceae bacterium]